MDRKKQQPEAFDIRDSSFTTRVQLSNRSSFGRRILWASAVALLGLTALILLGPSRQDIQDRFEFYGAPGDMKIMPNIAIEEGSDQLQQIPKTLQMPPPPPQIEIEPDDSTDGREIPKPRENENQETPLVDWPTTDPNPASEIIETNQVELQLPRQSNPDWFILNQVWPEYPFTAPEAEQRIPVIEVRVDIFVDPEGNVTDALLRPGTASSIFTNEVLEKIKQWKFGWRVDPLAGRWLQFTFRFNSPYADSAFRQR